MEDKDELKMLNPQISEVIIGVRNLRKIKIYPLSMADQLQMTSLIVTTLQELFSKKEENNLLFAEVIRKTLSANIGKIMSFVTDEGESLLKDISNVQACDIAELIYDTNYGALEKKVRSLIEKIKTAFHLPKSQQQSSEDTPNTTLSTSIKEGTEREE